MPAERTCQWTRQPEARKNADPCVAGTVEAIEVKEGASVKAGELIMTLKVK